MAAKSRKKQARRAPRTTRELRSGDPLVDWLFRQFVRALCDTKVRVVRKRRLVNPDDRSRTVIRGLMDPDIHPSGDWAQILINAARSTHRTRDDEVETLVHELAHLLLPKASERDILSVENIMAKRLTRQQRSMLKTFLPRHAVKRYPTKIAIV